MGGKHESALPQFGEEEKLRTGALSKGHQVIVKKKHPFRKRINVGTSAEAREVKQKLPNE